MWDKINPKRIVTNDEEVIVTLNKEACLKCRYILTDMTRRVWECQVHTDRMRHGLVTHPPHLYKVDEEGVMYYRDSSNSDWKRWLPDFSANSRRMAKR